MSALGIMEDVQQKLVTLNYPRSSVPFQSFLYAGMERYTLLEWLFFKLLGNKSPFNRQGCIVDESDRDEDGARTQYLAEIAKFLGLTPSIDTEAIQGKGSYENRAEMLCLLVNLVETSYCTVNPDWSIDDQVAKDIQLVDALAEKQSLIFSDECKLFPADVQSQSSCSVPEIAELENQLIDYTKQMAQVQVLVNGLATKQTYNPDEDYVEAEKRLQLQLQSFLDAAKTFDSIYMKEIRPWTHMMELPQLHGLGYAANRLLESYKLLLKLLRDLRNLQDSYFAIASGSDENLVSSAPETSSLGNLIADCEQALIVLNNGLNILSASQARVSNEVCHEKISM